MLILRGPSMGPCRILGPRWPRGCRATPQPLSRPEGAQPYLPLSLTRTLK